MDPRPEIGTVIAFVFRRPVHLDFYCLPFVVESHAPEDATTFTPRPVFDDGPNSAEEDHRCTMAGMNENPSEETEHQEWMPLLFDTKADLMHYILDAAKTHCKRVNFDDKVHNLLVTGALPAAGVAFQVGLVKPTRAPRAMGNHKAKIHSFHVNGNKISDLSKRNIDKIIEELAAPLDLEEGAEEEVEVEVEMEMETEMGEEEEEEVEEEAEVEVQTEVEEEEEVVVEAEGRAEDLDVVEEVRRDPADDAPGDGRRVRQRVETEPGAAEQQAGIEAGDAEQVATATELEMRPETEELEARLEQEQATLQRAQASSATCEAALEHALSNYHRVAARRISRDTAPEAGSSLVQTASHLLDEAFAAREAEDALRDARDAARRRRRRQRTPGVRREGVRRPRRDATA